MGWFDDQIKERVKKDSNLFSDAFVEMSSVVMGKKTLSDSLNDYGKQAQDSIRNILSFYNITPQEIPVNITEVSDQLEFLLRPTGVMKRDITLDGKWYKDGIGPLLATTVDDKVIALIPGKISGYRFFDSDLGKYVKVTAKNCGKISPEAICFYKPFPFRKLTAKDLFKYFAASISFNDYLMIIMASLAASLIGMLTPYVNGIIFGRVIEEGQLNLFIAAMVLLLGASVSALMIDVVKQLCSSRINTKMTIAVESATMMRILSLPAEFFKDYSAGDLANRLEQMKILCTSISSIFLTGGLSVLFSLVYVFQIFSYAPSLVLPSVGVILVSVLVFAVVTVFQVNNYNKMLEASSKERGLVFSLISGIRKIKLAGAEKRSFARWAKLYKQTSEKKYNPQTIVKIMEALIVAVITLGTAIIYYLAYKSKVSLAEYMAFSSAYGMVNGAFMSMIGMTIEISNIKPSINLIRPIMDAEPEVSEDKHVVTRLSGGIEINNVSFRYNENMPYVINKLNLKITPGQYVAIVGKTGCGKSTLMRIMLGFERPHKGAVYYDGKDLNTIELKSLRRSIGTVMQNGKLFSGDIYSNITISAPQLSVEQAWEAAEMAGVAEDIRRMPMGMHTLISEGSGGISGGQRQRLMIARAIAPKPKLLMFDEATSALDNITQKHVSDSLEKLKCTRIVIAHRLSTIKNCDRIIVLDEGRIVEDGKYDELIALNGMFAELVERQRLDI
ncbi:MAG: NHLP bacteriocin export ABC transporter permease/ATPase subunit [Ruminococcus sp.]|nr:NHLP bacteriocin export ABC transporter permease/ATPase subunit [Ruminococcus sp.]